MIKRLLLCLFLTTTGALAAPGGLLAQDDYYGAGRWWIGVEPGLGSSNVDELTRVKSDQGAESLGVFLGYSFADGLVGEISIDQLDQELGVTSRGEGAEPSIGKYELSLTSVGMVQHFLDGPARPFAGAGLSLGRQKLNDLDYDMWGGYGQVGISFALGSRVGLRVKHEYRFVDGRLRKRQQETTNDQAQEDDDWRGYGVVDIGLTVSF
jgi:outer membrane protein W